MDFPADSFLDLLYYFPPIAAYHLALEFFRKPACLIFSDGARQYETCDKNLRCFHF